jgi:phosphoribosylformylglycinamidine synthase
VADVAVFAQAHTGITGAATSIGEQPLKGLIDPAAMARLALAEAVTNLCLVRRGRFVLFGARGGRAL